jgi:2'-5' RNA ligase
MKKSLRLFFAIELDNALREALTKLIKALQQEQWSNNIRWTQPENLHITLRFIGECEFIRAADLLKQLMPAIHTIPAFTLQLDQLHLFPDPHQPRVIALGMQPSDELFTLVQALAASAITMGFPAENRAFLPHLSLGRILQPSSHIQLPITQLSLPPLHVTNLMLYKSEIIDEKRVYTHVAKLFLAA